MNILSKSCLTLLTSISVISCQNGKTANEKEAEQRKSTEVEKSIKGCYRYAVNKDTLQLAITAVNGNQVEGAILYNFYEKDDSKGIFKGTYSNGILNGEFTAEGEGKTSIREISFKKVGDVFVQGTGDMEQKGEKELFSKPTKINYGGNLKFAHTEECLP
ncbi:hypothetical protein [Pedobacter jamesrossensis]|uniref:Lipoprotein n=1 Tax=Pedobacter jamesrossensis TaxID=1908238 RepID=A0ABV8NKZ5_9SPHI